MKKKEIGCAVMAAALIVSSAGCAKKNQFKRDSLISVTKAAEVQSKSDAPVATEEPEPTPVTATPLERMLMKTDYANGAVSYVPQVEAYSPKEDLSDVKEIDRYPVNDEMKKKLAENLFVVTDGYDEEFFDLYENNRYNYYASFITTDSLMHTYHLYFAMLQENVEKKYLLNAITSVTENALKEAKKQYEALKGTEWEEASSRSVAFFAVAAKLLGADAEVPGGISSVVDTETEKVMSASLASAGSEVMAGETEDYTQYKPRGYYEGDADLEKYFRVMMWYGRTAFYRKNEDLNRTALLITLIMNDESVFNDWRDIYKVTSFFTGESDDLGYYEYLPAVDAAYGRLTSVSELPGDESSFARYQEVLKTLRAPAVNPVKMTEEGGETDDDGMKCFRFMGQRFTLDAAIFTQMCSVKRSDDGKTRSLPDALDVPAAMGSDTALDILVEKGNDRYPDFLSKMEDVREEIAAADGYWTSSLYGSWLHTLAPLLEEKGAGYPSFMTGKEWRKKSLEGFLGSFTELKHDTVLYGKQMYAEMGGEVNDGFDERGYVEPETELYSRLYSLVKTTESGLEEMGCLDATDKEGLERLAELTARLRDISVKELQNEALTDDEYELIKTYGGTLEHFWKDTVKGKTDHSEWIESCEYPAALVTDVATSESEGILEEATGRISAIYVIFPIDGELHVAKGGVYTYYQFVSQERLTDTEWREKVAFWSEDEPAHPEWTAGYRYEWSN